jgi:hypothetical protein
MKALSKVLTCLALPLLLSCATQDLNEAGSSLDTKPSSGTAAASQSADAANSDQSPGSAKDEGRGSVSLLARTKAFACRPPASRSKSMAMRSH